MRRAIVAVPAGVACYLAYGAGDGIRGAIGNDAYDGAQLVTGMRMAVELYAATLRANPLPVLAAIGAIGAALAIGPSKGRASPIFALTVVLASPPLAFLVGIACSSGDSRWVYSKGAELARASASDSGSPPERRVAETYYCAVMFDDTSMRPDNELGT